VVLLGRAGGLCDRFGARAVLGGAGVLAAVALLSLAVLASPPTAVAALAVSGVAYGATAVAVPVATARHFGAARATAVFARVFTAWGLAGLVAPVAAGAAYDATHGYGAVLVSLGAAAALAGAAGAALPPEPERS
ncbi:MAG TPA: MFS transporter, partial [Solirubrobacteraceae bacterium]|nr:MFS transporter [Solirubrobacteraceae bacterium]